MHIVVYLFQQLWPKAIKMTKYIANHTPIRKHKWKMLYELVKKHSFNFTHFKVYRCKAYNKINMLPKKQKFIKCARIGHLINYNSTNIFYIWISNKSKIVKTQDVTFNKHSLY